MLFDTKISTPPKNRTTGRLRGQEQKGKHSMTDFDIVSAISAIGFPAVVCVYTLVKIDATLDRLTAAITTIGARIDVLANIARNETGKNP